jgi:hypothetical protein
MLRKAHEAGIFGVALLAGRIAVPVGVTGREKN